MFRRIINFFKAKFKKRPINKPPRNPRPPIDYNGQSIGVQIHATKNFSDAEIEKFREAVEVMLVVINSLEFKTEIMNANFVKTNGMSNSEIYAKFMSGEDSFNKQTDNDIDIFVTMYYKNNRTIGLTYPNTWHTWINRKFFRYYDPADIAGNLTHEYLHNMNFGHRSRNYSYNSVPYRFGIIVSELAQQYINGRKLTPIKEKE